MIRAERSVGSASSARIYNICSKILIVNMQHMAYLRLMAKQTVFPVKKLVNLTDDQAQRIADFRYDNRIPSENEAIRQLIELGLQAAAASKDR